MNNILLYVVCLYKIYIFISVIFLIYDLFSFILFCCPICYVFIW